MRDMPSIFVHAERGGLTWAAIPDGDGYPVKFYDELATPALLVEINAVGFIGAS